MYTLKNNIYYSNDYLDLYLKENDEIFDFEYSEGDNIFTNKAIKRPINSELVEGNYFDLESVYGYGGYYTNSDDQSFIETAISKYKEHCLSANVIAEFLRFDPFNSNVLALKPHLNFLAEERRVISVPLNVGHDDVSKDYSSSLRRNIKKAVANEVTFLEMEKSDENRLLFFQLYSQTMKKNNAFEMYFFSEEYFEKLFKFDQVKLYGAEYQSNIVNMILVFENYDNVVYYHLGATNPEFYHLNTNAYLFDSIIKHYNNQFKLFFLGGGSSNDPQDSLYKYKQKFSKESQPFYIGGLKINEKIYDDLCGAWEAKNGASNMFLKYRF